MALCFVSLIRFCKCYIDMIMKTGLPLANHCDPEQIKLLRNLFIILRYNGRVICMNGMFAEFEEYSIIFCVKRPSGVFIYFSSISKWCKYMYNIVNNLLLNYTNSYFANVFLLWSNMPNFCITQATNCVEFSIYCIFGPYFFGKLIRQVSLYWSTNFTSKYSL